jgi:hypothetical protein
MPYSLFIWVSALIYSFLKNFSLILGTRLCDGCPGQLNEQEHYQSLLPF